MRALVTGAAGFIGMHLSERLLAEGVEVVGVDQLGATDHPRLTGARLARLVGRPHFTFLQLDVAEAGASEVLAAQAADVVVHLAALPGVRRSLELPRATVRANVQGLLEVLEACRTHRPAHLLYASSSSVYGLGSTVPYTEAEVASQPVSPYAATKRSNELMAHSWSHLFGIPATGLRFFTVYGPWGRPDMALYTFARRILDDRPIQLFNHGAMARDFTYVDDVVEAVMRLVGRPPSGPDAPHRVLNVGTGAPVSLLRFVEVLEHHLGRRARRELMPMQPGDVTETWACTRRLTDLVGPLDRTPIETGVGRFVDWLRAFEDRGESGFATPPATRPPGLPPERRNRRGTDGTR